MMGLCRTGRPFSATKFKPRRGMEACHRPVNDAEGSNRCVFSIAPSSPECHRAFGILAVKAREHYQNRKFSVGYLSFSIYWSIYCLILTLEDMGMDGVGGGGSGCAIGFCLPMPRHPMFHLLKVACCRCCSLLIREGERRVLKACLWLTFLVGCCC